MGWWAACIVISKVVAVSAGVVGAVALVTYGIYKVDMYMHEKRKRRKAASDIRNYEDIKAEAQDTKLIQSNVTKEVIQNKTNETKIVTEEDNNRDDVSRGSQEVQTVSEQDVQTETSDLQGPFLPGNENLGINTDDTASVASSATLDGTESTCDSLASTETVTSDVNLDLHNATIPTWYEMSDAAKELCLCKCCDKPVCTITIPCKHPFLCEECAPILMSLHHYCLRCEKRITCYQSV